MAIGKLKKGTKVTVEGDENPGTVYFVDEDYGDRVRLVPVKNPWGSGVNEPKKYVKVVSNTKFKVAKSAIIGATEVKRIWPEGQRAPIRLMKGANGHYYVVSADEAVDYGKNYRVASDKYDEVVAKIMPNSVCNANARRVRVLKAERLVPDRLVGQIVEVVGGRGDDVFVKDPKFPRLNIPTLLKKGEYEVVNSVCNIRPVRAPKSAVIGATEIKTVKPEGQKVPLKFVRGKDGHYYVIFKDGQLDYGSDIREATKGFDEAVRFQSWTGTHMNSVRNVKFKVGDRIEFYSTLDGWLPGVVTEVFDGGERYKVRDSIGAIAGRYTVDKQHIRSRNAANSVGTTNAVVAKALNAVADKALNAVVDKALAMNGAEEKWGDPNAKMLKEKNGWQLWEGTHGYGMYRSNGHGGVWWGKVRRAAAIKHFDKFVADPIRTPLTINAVRNAWADAPDAATAKRDIEQTVRKAADIAKRQSGAKATYKMTPNDNFWCGYIELTFNTEEEAKKYNPYYLFDELGDNKSILPKWSWAISSFNYQKNGKVVKIFVGRLAT